MLQRFKNAWSALRTDPKTIIVAQVPDAVQQFTTDDEPKIKDYPKGMYYAYWEILIGEVPGGWTAVVRFYPNIAAPQLTGDLVYTFVAPRLQDLKPKVNHLIRTRMEDFRR